MGFAQGAPQIHQSNLFQGAASCRCLLEILQSLRKRVIQPVQFFSNQSCVAQFLPIGAKGR